MDVTINLKQIYKFNGEDVVVVGLSKVEQLSKMRDIGCIGSDKFKTLSIAPNDDKIKKDSVIIFRQCCYSSRRRCSLQKFSRHGRC